MISGIIVIPAFNEMDSLPQLLGELAPELTSSDMIIVVDDSNPASATMTEERCRTVVVNAECQITFIKSASKGGRGGAVRRGFVYAINTCPNAHKFLECDADGSHRANDILGIYESDSISDLLVGSRYLQSSKIIGWSFSRRLQSRLLNALIPRILRLPLTDITNGLRRYSRRAVEELLSFAPKSSGFIYLSEQAVIVHQSQLTIEEVPIIFAERRAGVSSVTSSELRQSLVGLLNISRHRKQLGTARTE
jgi:dolichol-phosphate mannosyltransferase